MPTCAARQQWPGLQTLQFDLPTVFLPSCRALLCPLAELQTVAPLERIEYVAAPRQLPSIRELGFRAEGGAELPSEAAQAAARSAAAAAAPGVPAYLAARAALLQGLPEGLDVAFEGVEAGKPTAVVRPVPEGGRGTFCRGWGAGGRRQRAWLAGCGKAAGVLAKWGLSLLTAPTAMYAPRFWQASSAA